MEFLEIVKVNFVNKIPTLGFNEIHENDGENDEVPTRSKERKEKSEIVIELSSDTEVDQEMKDKACKIQNENEKVEHEEDIPRDEVPTQSKEYKEKSEILIELSSDKEVDQEMKDVTIKTQNETQEVDHEEEILQSDPSVVSAQVGKLDFTSTSSWDDIEINYFGPNKIPYCPGFTSKLTKSETYALIKFKTERAVRVPQACRKNCIFVIDTRKMANIEDAKSDLNGKFPICHEAKTHTVSVSCLDGKFSVKLLVNKKMELQEKNVLMKVNRRENSHGLVRSMTHFLDSKDNVINSTLVVQYYLDTKVCGDQHELTFNVEPNGNSKKQRSFFVSRKAHFKILESSLCKEKKQILFTMTHIKTWTEKWILGMFQGLKIK